MPGPKTSPGGGRPIIGISGPQKTAFASAGLARRCTGRNSGLSIADCAGGVILSNLLRIVIISNSPRIGDSPRRGKVAASLSTPSHCRPLPAPFQPFPISRFPPLCPFPAPPASFPPHLPLPIVPSSPPVSSPRPVSPPSSLARCFQRNTFPLFHASLPPCSSCHLPLFPPLPACSRLSSLPAFPLSPLVSPLLSRIVCSHGLPLNSTLPVDSTGYGQRCAVAFPL